jgi:hypothetical protein
MEKSTNPFYTLRCYGRHEIQTYYKGKEKLELRDSGWKRFNHSFDINYAIIIDYMEYILFDDAEDTGTRCIKVVFQDYSSVYAAYTLESFEKWLKENYLPLYNNNKYEEPES